MNGLRAAHASAARQRGLEGRTPGVEPGVTGKEKVFQQGNQFGPGPTKPYPFSKPPAAPGPRPIPSGGDPRLRYRTDKRFPLRQGERRA